jgi:hypothetical protein
LASLLHPTISWSEKESSQEKKYNILQSISLKWRQISPQQFKGNIIMSAVITLWDFLTLSPLLQMAVKRCHDYPLTWWAHNGGHRLVENKSKQDFGHLHMGSFNYIYLLTTHVQSIHYNKA